MKKHIENFYKHIQDSCRDFDKKNFDLDEIHKIVIAGMGGSAIAGLILKDLLLTLSIYSHNKFLIQSSDNQHILLFLISSQGILEENVDAFNND